MTEKTEQVELHETAKQRYLNYAMSVITSRALPDVRDGLKPVQRRILYAMSQNLNLSHDAKPRKSAAIVGEVMGKYHPHGDQSIYDAMVRMAQPFSMRAPLVDGHGNFGSLDGDSPAAMRYTEARLAPIASELLDEIDSHTVEFRSNYDGTETEPLVLPAQLPNLLINGATGIAVGMATNIPPHSVEECIDALMALIERPDLETEDLLGTHIRGPDFPTGGVVLNTPEELEKIYKTGSGTIHLRSTWEVETKNHKKYLVVTGLPYTVNKSSLVESIADAIVGGDVPQLVDVRDESTDDVRVVLQIKRGTDPETVLAYLFKHTKLQTRFHVNLTALVPETRPSNPIRDTDQLSELLEQLDLEPGARDSRVVELAETIEQLKPDDEAESVPVPEVLDLKAILEYFLEFRMQVLVYRLLDELGQLLDRIHILEGFEIIFDALDKALELIRASKDKSDARDSLMEHFELDTDQANAILKTPLYRLARLEIESVREELAEKRDKADRIRVELLDEQRRWGLIENELNALRKAYGDGRYSRIDADRPELDYSEKDYIVDEDVWVMVSRDGWLKRQKSYSDLSTIRVRDNDSIGWVLPAHTPKSALFFTNRGRVYTMRVNEVPDTTGHGDPLQALFSFDDGEQVVGVVTEDDRVFEAFAPEQLELSEQGDWTPEMVALTEQGRSVRIDIDDYLTPSTVKGRMFMRLEDGDEVINVEPARGDELVSIASRDGRGLNIPVDDINKYKGTAKGVYAIRLEEGDDVLDFTLTSDRYEGLEVETNNGRKTTISPSKSKFEPVSRGSKGKWVIKRGHLVRSHRPPMELRRQD